MADGILVVVSGFSGSGKGTLMKKLMSEYDNYALSISATTRSPRKGEKEGREYFFRSKEEFEKHVGKVDFIQDNESKSSYGVLRGLHYQKGDSSQAKLVRVVKGKVLDVAVDMRRSSPTFGKYVAVELSEENKRQLFVPRGFAHGFLVLSPEAIFNYKVDNGYSPQDEVCIRWNDETLGIKWPIEYDKIITSPKDLKGKSLNEVEGF